MKKILGLSITLLLLVGCTIKTAPAVEDRRDVEVEEDDKDRAEHGSRGGHGGSGGGHH